ncbi:hypothetical protein RHMOL_Rhmol01G0349500 [Rhododendron molle]|uniref:Uncharacterized protein n=1 Tax=Rhododendron molle TaxID=49168 RepID=A0ACC0QAU7_RHOML|nr:hypothetical protein RHMOL_Rhmol01G0349500 [Rhododendron molle]
MGLRDIGDSLPPGFRFYPSDEELVCHYLYKKIANEDVLRGTLVEIDLHVCEPWQLPEVAKLNSSEWYFFSFRDRKYATGYRANRATTSGYWKATGKDRTVHDPRTGDIAGMRKTLVFYLNRAPNGIKTGWIMHEFRLENPHMPPKEDWVLCRVFNKSKEENSNKLLHSPPQYVFENTKAVAITSPYVSTSPPNHQYHTMTTSFSLCPPHQNQDRNNPASILQNSPVALKYHNSLPRSDDEYDGFLFDMNFEEHGFGDHGVDLNFAGTMEFDDDRENLVFP